MKCSFIFVIVAAIAISAVPTQGAPVQTAPEQIAHLLSGSDATSALGGEEAIVKALQLDPLRYDDDVKTMTRAVEKLHASRARSSMILPELKKSFSDVGVKYQRDAEFKPVDEKFGVKSGDDLYFAPFPVTLQRTLSDLGRAPLRTLNTQARYRGLARAPTAKEDREPVELKPGEPVARGRLLGYYSTVQRSKIPNNLELFWRKARTIEENRQRGSRPRPLALSIQHKMAQHALELELKKPRIKAPGKIASIVERLPFNIPKVTTKFKLAKIKYLHTKEEARERLASARKDLNNIRAARKEAQRAHEAHSQVEDAFNFRVRQLAEDKA